MPKAPQKRQLSISGNDASKRERKRDSKKLKSDRSMGGLQAKDSFPKLITRSTPRLLVKAIASFNDDQKNAVVDMGFGGLLSLRIKKFPARLIYWLIENFNPISSELVLGNGRYLHIDWKDVERVLGFPNGPIIIAKKKKSEQCDIYDEWPKIFDREDYKITAGDVCKKMIDCKDGGDWFRRYFVILVDSLIVGNLQCGYVNPLILNCLFDVRNIKKMNWCEYTLKTLIKNRVRWGASNKSQFNGPLLFLTVLYMDRVVVCTRDLPRSLPSLVGWSSEKIKKRSSYEIDLGGFGFGFVDNPYVGESSSVCNVASLVASREKDTNMPETSLASDGVQGYNAKLLSKLSCVATDIVEVISLLLNPPRDFASDAGFLKIRDLARKLIGLNGNPNNGPRINDVGNVKKRRKNVL